MQIYLHICLLNGQFQLIEFYELLYITRHSEISSMNRSMVAYGLFPQRMTLICSSKYSSPWLRLYCHFCGSQDVCCPHFLWECALWTAAGWAWLCVTQDVLTNGALPILLWAMGQPSNARERNKYTTTVWSTASLHSPVSDYGKNNFVLQKPHMMASHLCSQYKEMNWCHLSCPRCLWYPHTRNINLKHTFQVKLNFN